MRFVWPVLLASQSINLISIVVCWLSCTAVYILFPMLLFLGCSGQYLVQQCSITWTSTRLEIPVPYNYGLCSLGSTFCLRCTFQKCIVSVRGIPTTFVNQSHATKVLNPVRDVKEQRAFWLVDENYWIILRLVSFKHGIT